MTSTVVVSGHMACCKMFAGTPPVGGCDFGISKKPECPPTLPEQGTPCGDFNVCNYDHGCCTTNAYCTLGGWSVTTCAFNPFRACEADASDASQDNDGIDAADASIE